MFRRSPIFLVLDQKVMFDWVGRTIFPSCFSLKGVSVKSVSLIRSLNMNSRMRVRACKVLPLELIMRCDVLQECPLSLFLFNFVLEIVI